MSEEVKPIAKPVLLVEAQKYSGDIQQMSSRYKEVGYRTDIFQILNANGEVICDDITSRAVANEIVEALTRNDQAVIDGFLARVDDLELEQACDGTLQNPKSYRDLVQDVHAEMFGGEDIDV